MGILTSILRKGGQASLFATFATLMLATPAAAQDLSPITTMLQSIGTALTGPVGRALGLVALAAVGILFLTGRMNWLYAGSVVVGLVILFGAATILAGF